MTTPKLALIPSAYKAGTVYSPLPTNGDGDFTFTRNSTGTRINKDGFIENLGETLSDELVTNGGFDTNSNWTVIGEDATHIATFNNSLRYQSDTTSPVLSVNQYLVFEVGKTYKIQTEISDITSGYVKTDAFGASNNLNASIGTNIIYGVATSTTLNILRGTTNVDVTIDSISVKEVLTEVNIPRLDYSDGKCPSLLLEPSRTNNILNSESLSPAAWIKYNAGVPIAPIVTDNYAISPSGEMNASRLQLGLNGGTSSSDRTFIRQSITSQTDYYFSVYLKSTDGSEQKLVWHFGGSDFLITVTNEWQRFELTRSGAATVYAGLELRGNLVSQLGIDNSVDVLVYGFQVEQGDYATSYIPTNGSIATRVGDLCIGAGNSNVFNDSEGVLFLKGKFPNTSATGNRYITLSDGGGSPYVNQISFYFFSNARVFVYIGGISSATQAFRIENIDIQNSEFRIALQYKFGDNKLFFNGVEYAQQGAFVDSNLTGLNDLSVTLNNSVSFSPNIKVKDLRYYDTALTDAELTELTTL